MVPLIDVMLVLLVIFIITAPLLTQAVKLELPKATSQANDLQAREDRVRDRRRRRAVLERRAGRRAPRRSERFAAEGKKPAQPEVHLRADQGVAYRFVAQTLADASKAGLTKVGFISEAETDGAVTPTAPPASTRRRCAARHRRAPTRGAGAPAHGRAVARDRRARRCSRGAAEVQIDHRGALYRLKQTSLGKLILTK